jgi:outer membrane lipoprotein carrier protein
LCACLILSPLFSRSQSPPVQKDAAKNTTAPPLHQFEHRYRTAKTLSSTFLETYRENGRLVRVEAGQAYFMRPGKMRWEYESPEKNLFLVDGKTAWFYVPQDHTVTRVPARQSGDWRTPLALLAGEMKVSRLCAHVEIATTEKTENPENVLMYCALRAPTSETAQELQRSPNQESPDAVFFEIVRATGHLARILVRQSGGISLEFRFANWRFDPPLPEKLFHFAPERGVAIVNGELPAKNSATR